MKGAQSELRWIPDRSGESSALGCCWALSATGPPPAQPPDSRARRACTHGGALVPLPA